jgi:hypothetical protein
VNERQRGLRRVTERMLRRRASTGTADASGPLWEAGVFGLDRHEEFRCASETQRLAILHRCSAALVAESWSIEVCGIAFCARMALQSEDLEERRLYAIIGADEAAHSAWLEPWLGDTANASGPFESFIAGLTQSGSQRALAYLLQVVLEGFGIVHYGQLATFCRDPALATILARISQDEALHHAGGLASFRAEVLNDHDRQFLIDASATFLDMMRCGPQAVVRALDEELGVGDRTTLDATFTSLDAAAVSAAKLDRLRRLMDRPGMSWLMAELDTRGVFTPCTAAQCADIYRASS